MGLLDEAIREHLELKRRRGADPTEVAREQREALDTPDAPDETAEAVGELDADGSAETERATAVPVLGDEEAVAGETAELDMQAVLAEDVQGTHADTEEDSLEWEIPHRSAPLPADKSSSGTAPE